MKGGAAVSFVTALCLSTVSVRAGDGILIVIKTETPSGTRTQQVQIEKGQMRTESTAGGRRQVVVFDAARQVLQIIDFNRKTYTYITRGDAERMGAQVSDAMGRLQQQMADMSPQQRAQMDALMRGRMGGAAMTDSSKIEYRKTGTGHVRQWTCDKYEGYRAEVKVVEVCTVEPRTLGLAPAEVDVTTQMADFFGRIVPQSRDQMLTVGTIESAGFSGVPVRRVAWGSGRIESTMEITAVTRKNFPSSSYEVPSRFEEQVEGK